MANKITTRAALATWVKVELGEPVIRVNVADQQVEHCIDKALDFFWEWHRDGSVESFVAYQITAQDVTNGYIPVDQAIDDIVEIFPKRTYSSSESFATVDWQIQSAIWSASASLYSVSPVDYMLSLQAIDTISTVTGSETKYFNFEKFGRKLYPRFIMKEGEFIFMRVYRNIDPSDANYSEAYNDTWLKEYTCALVKMAWGGNLKKFAGVRLPGNIDLNGQQIYDEGLQEKTRLEEVLKNEHQAPPMFFIG